MKHVLVGLLLLQHSLSCNLLAVQTKEIRTIMDLGQCPPQYDQESGFWGYDCLYYPDPTDRGTPKHIKIAPQFSFATPFINGRAKVLLGCRLASCRHEPRGRKYHRRLYVFISDQYDFEPSGPYDPEIWNPKHYAIYNEAFVHAGHFDRDYLGLACVAYQGQLAQIDRDGNVVFVEREDGKIGVPFTQQLSDFLNKNKVPFSRESDMVVLERAEEVWDFILEEYKPPITPIKAGYYASQ